MEEVGIKNIPPVPAEIKNPDVLASFIVNSLGLFPKKGKGDVPLKMIQIFAKIAGKREDVLRVGKEEIKVKNGAIKVEDLHKMLEAEGVKIGLSQLYTTYLSKMVRAGIVVKKKHSMYGLRADSLADTVRELMRDVEKVLEKIEEHAKRLDIATRTQ